MIGAAICRSALDLDQECAVLRGQPPAPPGDRPLGSLEAAVGQLLCGEPDLQVRAPDLGFELTRGTFSDDAPEVDDSYAVREPIRLLEVLRGQEYSRALAVEFLDLLPDGLPANGVEPSGRLVEEQDPRLVDERGGEVEATAHPPE